MSVTAASNTGPASYVTLPRELLLKAIEHVQGTRFNYPGHHLGPQLRQYLAAPTIAHATADRPPVTDQATLANTLRMVAELVHVRELQTEVGRIIATALLPHATGDQWDELVHTVGIWFDLDHGAADWRSYDDGLPLQAEDRQAVATDLAGQDVERLIWILLNPGERLCEDCDGPAELMAAALPLPKVVCGKHLHRREQQVAVSRGLHPAGGAR